MSYWIVFEGEMFTLRGHWRPIRVTQGTSGDRLAADIAGLYRSYRNGNLISIEVR